MPWITSVLISKKASQYCIVLPRSKANLDLPADDTSVFSSSELGFSGRFVSLATVITPGMFLEIQPHISLAFKLPRMTRKKIGGLERATFHSGGTEGKGKLTFYLNYVGGPTGQSNYV
jgi:hypothetical protein